MRIASALVLPLALLSVPFTVHSQQPPQRDPQAIAILQKSLLVMGGVVPPDSVATGSVELTAGSTTEKGTVRILTRALEQSIEEIATDQRKYRLIYSRGRASESLGDSVKQLPLELAVTSQAKHFPLVVIARALTQPNTAAQYVGLETQDSVACHHIRISNAPDADPKRQHLSEFSARDIWIDSVTGLPRRIAHVRRASKGPNPGVRFETLYSDYRNIGGILYPFLIQKTASGTVFLTFRIEAITFNAGLTDNNFALR